MGLTSKYCDKDIKHDEDDDGEDKRMTEGKWRRKAIKTVLFKNIVFIAYAPLRHKSPLPLTILPIAIGGVRPSPTILCRSSGSRTGAACQPRQRHQRDFPSPFLSPSSPESDRSTESNAAPLMPRLHLRLNPHPRTQFSILSVSITAHSPLTFSPPIYRTFSTSRAFIPRAINNR